jgi:hypothetical protein
VNVDIRPHLDFFDLDRLLLLARLGGFLLRLVLEAAVIEDLGDGRLGIRGDFDEIKTGLGGNLQRAVDRYIAVVGTLVVDQLNFADSDFLVDPRPVLGRCRRGSVGSANGGILLYCCCWGSAGRSICPADQGGFVQSDGEVNHYGGIQGRRVNGD